MQNEKRRMRIEKFFILHSSFFIILHIFLPLNNNSIMAEIKSEETSEKKSLNFIEQIVENDLKEGKTTEKYRYVSRRNPTVIFIGHAKAICLDFGIAAAHGGVCNLRFDDTNYQRRRGYVDAPQEVFNGWATGGATNTMLPTISTAMRTCAIPSHQKRVTSESRDVRTNAAQKGTPTQPGVESPYRNRPIEETLDLFQKMNTGEIEEGAMVLRAKIDMASPNMHFRDPIIYRVVKHPHHRTGTAWKAYPMYDFAHGQSDYFEGVTHSLCTLEFVLCRPLHDCS